MTIDLAQSAQKFCTGCSTVKPRSEFSHRWQKSNGCGPYRVANAYCKECAAARARDHHQANKDAASASARKSKLKLTYGLSLDDYDRMLREQGNACAICASKVPGGPGRFHVDHCHSSGLVRGHLCCNCNRGIGALRDDPEVLRKAISYLEAAHERGST